MNKTLGIILAAVFATSNTYAINQALWSANNQAFINGQLNYDRLSYGANRPGDAGAPVFNSHGGGGGVQIGFTKTAKNLYSQLTLSENRVATTYSDAALGVNNVTNGVSNTLTWGVRLGYELFPRENIQITPYVAGGYNNNQLYTGGYTSSFSSVSYNGASLMTENYYYGIGVLGQWAATKRWVLSLDALYGSQFNPWVYGSVNNFNNQAGAAVTYQQWNISSAQFWQLALGSDFLLTSDLHFKAGVAFGRNNLGGANTAATGIYPNQYHQYTLGYLGLGYSFADIPVCDCHDAVHGGQDAIHAVNNEASISVGESSQGFNGGTTATPYTQASSIPYISLEFNKTWKKIFAQISSQEGSGNASAGGRVSTFDAAAKVGYQFTNNPNTAVTPYATAGYHRGMQNIRGTSFNPGAYNNLPGNFYINGFTETYQHNWLGIGMLLQWAAMPVLVFNTDLSIGRTVNGNMQSWLPLSQPQNTSYNLDATNYHRISLGGDYYLGQNWHLLAKLHYTYYTYAPSSTNSIGVRTITDTTHAFGADIGFGYSFGA